MTNAQKLDLRSRAIKTRLNELSGVDELTPELRSEIEALTVELPDVELRYAAAVTSEASDAAAAAIAEQDGDGESTEKRALLRRAKLAHYIKASIDQRGVDPASVEGECAAAFGCSGLVPLELFGVSGPAEVRASYPGSGFGDRCNSKRSPCRISGGGRVGEYLGITLSDREHRRGKFSGVVDIGHLVRRKRKAKRRRRRRARTPRTP